MKIGITGHTNLTPASITVVRDALRTALAPYVEEGITGVTCLAKGADQIHAQVVLELGGEVVVVLPSRNYREKKVKPANRDQFDDLLSDRKSVV